MSGSSSLGDVFMPCRVIRERTGIREYLTRDLELSRAPVDRVAREKKSKKLIEFYRGLVYLATYTFHCRNTHRGWCGACWWMHRYRKVRGARVCVFRARLQHTYGGHFRCDGVINGNWIEPPSTPSQGYRPAEIYRAEIQSSRHGP